MQFEADIDHHSLEQAKQGDLAAQERLYRHYERRVYSLAYRMMGQAADAQDVMQDSFIRCFQALSQYRGDAPFWAWLKQLTVRTALMRLRSRKRWAWWQTQDADEALDNDVDQSQCPQSDPADKAQTQAELQQLLAVLNGTARAVVYLYHAEGYSHAEIAKLWGKSVSFSKSQLARAHQQIRQYADKMLDQQHSTTAGQALDDADKTAASMTLQKEVLS